MDPKDDERDPVEEGTGRTLSRGQLFKLAGAAVTAAAHAQLPEAGWDIRTRSNASPAFGAGKEIFTLTDPRGDDAQVL